MHVSPHASLANVSGYRDNERRDAICLSVSYHHSVHYSPNHQAQLFNRLCCNSVTFHTLPAPSCQVSENDGDQYQHLANIFSQISHPSSLQLSLSAPFSTTQLRLPSSRLSLVTPITGPKPQIPRRNSSSPRRPPAPPPPGVHPWLVAPFSLTVSAP